MQGYSLILFFGGGGNVELVRGVTYNPVDLDTFTSVVVVRKEEQR